MEQILSTQQQKIHPHKMLVWIGIGSIIMMFAGWTSAFIVRKAQGNWKFVQVPSSFWLSTIVILASSLTLYFAVDAFKKRNNKKYKSLITLTAILGAVFMVLQYLGFKQMMQNGFYLDSKGDTVSGTFIYVIAFIHILHILGGVIALIRMYYLAHFKKDKRIYSSTGIEVVSIYWHFVDILWVYLFLFFIFNQS
jgi:cytochrome c oxidase subunit 3